MEKVEAGQRVVWHYQACQRGGRKRRATVVKSSVTGTRVLVAWDDDGKARESWVAPENLSPVLS
jgi:hypothetical protein